MYFKYRSIEKDELIIKEAKSVEVIKDKSPYEDGREKYGWKLCISPKANEMWIAQNIIEYFCAVLIDPITANRNAIKCEETKSGITPPYDLALDEYNIDCEYTLKWFSSLEKAEKEMQKIADAISRGDKLYDLTMEEN